MSDRSDDDLAWETIDTGIDYRCPGFDVRRSDVRLPDGTETDYHHVEEVETVVVLPFRPGGEEVVLIEEWRQAVDRVNRGLPAGGVEPGEDDLEAAARRELREETGYVADSMTHLCTTEPVNGIANSTHHTFVARGCELAAEQDLDLDEQIRALTMTYDDLVDAVRDGEIRDGRAALAVSRYELD